MTVRKILQKIRVVFLGVSLAAVGAAYVWDQQPEFVERVDGWFMRRYTHDAYSDLKRAEDHVAGDRSSDAIRVLDILVPSLRHVGRIHRLEPARKRALALLSDLLAERGDVDRSLEFADELHELDDRDLLNAVRRTDLLHRLGRDDESFAAIEAAARVGLRNPMVANAYLVSLARFESPDAAVLTILRHADQLLPRPPASGWESMILPLTGPMIKLRISSTLDASGRMQWVVPVTPEPVVAKRIRLDLPTTTMIRLDNLSIILRTTGDHEHVLDLANLRRSPRIEREGDSLVYRGGNDPFLVLDVPESMQAEALGEVEYRAQVRAVLSAELCALVAGAGALQDRGALTIEFGEEVVQRLEEALR